LQNQLAAATAMVELPIMDEPKAVPPKAGSRI
jgi:hypothetical protein